MAMIPTASAYGPDSDQPVQMPWVYSFSLDVGYGAYLTFSSSAGYEQALIIYRAATWEKMVEKGTYTPLRDLKPATLLKNQGTAPVEYFVTGWYKGDTQLTGWRQSQFRSITPDGVTTIVGFDDSKNDLDFDDIVVTIVRSEDVKPSGQRSKNARQLRGLRASAAERVKK